MKPVILRVLLLLVSAAVSITLMEWTLRLTRYGSISHFSGEHVLRGPHETRGWTLLPGRSAYQRSMDYAVWVGINQHGLRDRPHDYEPEEGVFRVLVLGDSFMEAYQVLLEESLPYRLQEQLADRRVEVVNLGIGGYGTAQEILYLQEEGLRYQPDLVLLAFFTGNDIQNNSRALQLEMFGPKHEKTFGRPYASVEALEAPIEWTPPDFERMSEKAESANRRRSAPGRAVTKFLQPTVLGNLIRQAYARIAARLGAPPAPPKAHFGWTVLEGYESDDWSDAWLVTRRLMLEGQSISRAAGADFAIMLVPGKVQVDEQFRALARAQYQGVNFDPTRVNRALRAFCEENGIALFDPTEVFARMIAAGEPLYYQLEDHPWNPRGHEVATEGLIRFLDEKALVPAPPATP